MQETETIMVPLDVEKINSSISAGVEKVKEVRLKITNLVQEGEVTHINGFEDKEGYEATRNLLRKTVPLRTELERERKDVVRAFNDPRDAISKLYTSCTADIAAIEERHKKAVKDFDEYHENKKREKQMEAAKIVEDKKNLLLAAGLEYNPQNGAYCSDLASLQPIAVTLLDITNMDDERFALLLSRAQARKDELQEQKREEAAAEERVNKRKKALYAIGVVGGPNGGMALADMETGDVNFQANDDELRGMGDLEFNALSDRASEIVARNKKYQEDLRAAANKLKEDQELLKAEKEKMNRDKVGILQTRLGAAGFKFNWAEPIETASFEFKNEYGLLKFKADELLDNEESVAGAVRQANDLISKKTEADEKAQTEKRDRENKDEELRKQKEARKKITGPKELKLIDDSLGVITGEVSVIKNLLLTVIGDYAGNLAATIEAAILKFNTDVSHLR